MIAELSHFISSSLKPQDAYTSRITKRMIQCLHYTFDHVHSTCSVYHLSRQTFKYSKITYRILHECSCFMEFIKRVEEKR